MASVQSVFRLGEIFGSVSSALTKLILDYMVHTILSTLLYVDYSFHFKLASLHSTQVRYKPSDGFFLVQVQ